MECDERDMFFLSIPHVDAPLGRHYLESAPPRKLTFGKRLANVFNQHVGLIGLASLDERSDFLGFPRARCT